MQNRFQDSVGGGFWSPVRASLQIIVLEYNFDIPIFRAKSEPPTWPSGGAQRLKNLFDPFDGVQSLKSVGEEVWWILLKINRMIFNRMIFLT